MNQKDGPEGVGDRDDNIGLKDVTYTPTTLCGDVERFTIPKYDEIYNPTMKDHPFYRHHNQNFSVERFLYSTIPVHIGEFDIKFDRDNVTNVLRCPIKIAGNREIVLPKELSFLKEYIEYCCVYENCFNDRRTYYS
jgi:hypothetical protein